MFIPHNLAIEIGGPFIGKPVTDMDTDHSSHACPDTNGAPDSTSRSVVQQQQSGIELSISEKEKRDLCDRQKAAQQKIRENNLIEKNTGSRRRVDNTCVRIRETASPITMPEHAITEP